MRYFLLTESKESKAQLAAGAGVDCRLEGCGRKRRGRKKRVCGGGGGGVLVYK